MSDLSPIRHATITEIADAADNVGTTYTMSVGDSFVGTISDFYDVDWIAITLQEGFSYGISLTGTGQNDLQDPYLIIYDSNGNPVTYNDDYSGLDSYVNLPIYAGGGTYYISAESYYTNNPSGGFTDTGTYTLSVTLLGEVTPLPVYSYDQIAYFLTDTGQTQWNETRQSFDVAPGGTLTFNVQAMDAGGQEFARAAVQAWENVTGIHFVEVTGSADITYDMNDTGMAAYTSTSVIGGTIQSANITITSNWFSGDWASDAGGARIELDSYSFQTFVHETGHALGLAHPGFYDGSASYPIDAVYANDSWQATIMSYFSQTDNTSITASYAYDVTPMIADILAVHDLYGAPTDQRTGDTVYNTYLTALYPDANFGPVDQPIAMTIYDNGGIDRIDVSDSNADQYVTLVQEGISNTHGLIGNIVIARDTVIENARTGDGNDVLQGNAIANRLTAGGGNDLLNGDGGHDVLIGGLGIDTLRGEDGNDTLYGGDGRDTLNGGSGDDVIFGGDTSDDRSDYILCGDGNDSADGGWGNDSILGGNGSDTIEGNYGADTVIGNDGDDFLNGSVYSDQVFGGNGNDFINGGFGNDRLNGGADADTFYHTGLIGHGSDWISDYSAIEGDVLRYGGVGAVRNDFQVNYGATGAGDINLDEAFIIYRPTGQILWALVDGEAQSDIMLQIGANVYDLV